MFRPPQLARMQRRSSSGIRTRCARHLDETRSPPSFDASHPHPRSNHSSCNRIVTSAPDPVSELELAPASVDQAPDQPALELGDGAVDDASCLEPAHGEPAGPAPPDDTDATGPPRWHPASPRFLGEVVLAVLDSAGRDRPR